MEIEKKAKELRSSLGIKKKNESENETRERMKKVLNERDAAIQAIYDYQEVTGIPTKEEINNSFFNDEIQQRD
jgi:hypothetical protein